MSIVTKTGDRGTSALMYGHRVPKTHLRLEACGSVDELNAALGLARASGSEAFVSENIFAIQKDLVGLMGEVATAAPDAPRYAKDGFSVLTPEQTARLDRLVKEIEAQNVSLKGWATPGATMHAAALDLARTACRRAERSVCALHEAGELPNEEILIYLNRLSDLLWLFARWAETKAEAGGR